MPQYMVEFQIPVPFSEELSSKIPEQRKVMEDLLAQSQLVSYCFSLETGKMWCVFNANNAEEVKELVLDFPLIDFMPFSTHELFFNRTPMNFVPSFSLN